jgi:hypothetical protein
MAEEKDEIVETEADRRMQYRKLRASGVSDSEATEKVWPSTRAGLKVNSDEKIVRDEKAEKKRQAGKEKKE